MRLTVSQLRRIIKEEVSRVMEAHDFETTGTYDHVGPGKQADVNARVRLLKPVAYTTSRGKRDYYRGGKVYDAYVNDNTGRAWLNKGLGSIQVALPDGSWEEIFEDDPEYVKKPPMVGDRAGADYMGGTPEPGERNVGY